MSRIKIIGLSILGLLLVIQFIRPEQTNPPVDPAADIQAVAQPPAEVMTILREACYDCHSNEAKYPWYASITPVSFFVQNHIDEGRSELNFSTFGQLSAEERAEKLGEAAEAVQEGEMPLSSYTWLHPKARLNAAQRDLLTQWLQSQGGEGGTETEEDE